MTLRNLKPSLRNRHPKVISPKTRWRNYLRSPPNSSRYPRSLPLTLTSCDCTASSSKRTLETAMSKSLPCTSLPPRLSGKPGKALKGWHLLKQWRTILRLQFKSILISRNEWLLSSMLMKRSMNRWCLKWWWMIKKKEQPWKWSSRRITVIPMCILTSNPSKKDSQLTSYPKNYFWRRTTVLQFILCISQSIKKERT